MRYSELSKMFTYHPPKNAEQIARYQRLREGGHILAKTILECTPSGADQDEAIRKVREAIMTANAAIAIGEE